MLALSPDPSTFFNVTCYTQKQGIAWYTKSPDREKKAIKGPDHLIGQGSLSL